MGPAGRLCQPVAVVPGVIAEYLEQVDAILARLNVPLLLIVSFLPFPTRLLAEYLSAEDAEKVAVTI